MPGRTSRVGRTASYSVTSTTSTTLPREKAGSSSSRRGKRRSGTYAWMPPGRYGWKTHEAEAQESPVLRGVPVGSAPPPRSRPPGVLLGHRGPIPVLTRVDPAVAPGAPRGLRGQVQPEHVPQDVGVLDDDPHEQPRLPGLPSPRGVRVREVRRRVPRPPARALVRVRLGSGLRGHDGRAARDAPPRGRNSRLSRRGGHQRRCPVTFGAGPTQVAAGTRE